MSITQDLINRARELFLRYGIRNVTMDDIAKDLGISKKTLYTYVSTKAELIDKITDQYIEQKKKALVNARSQSDNAIDEIIQTGRHVSQSLRGIQTNTMFALKKYYRESWVKMEKHFFGYVYASIRENTERGMKEGLYRQDIHPEVIAKIYVGRTMLVADEDIFPSRDYDPKMIFEEYFTYHIRGIASAKGLELLDKYTNK